jgi:hypothetical protein
MTPPVISPDPKSAVRLRGGRSVTPVARRFPPAEDVDARALVAALMARSPDGRDIARSGEKGVWASWFA